MDTFQSNTSTLRDQSQGETQSQLNTRMLTAALVIKALRKKERKRRNELKCFA